MAVVDMDDVALVLDYQTTLNRMADTAGAITRELWLDLPSYDRGDIPAFIEAAKPYIAGARAEGAELATGLLAELAGMMPRSVDLRFSEPAWHGAFTRMWHDLKVGHQWEQARLGGASQAQSLGFDAAQNGATLRMTNSGLRTVGYRRVTQPGACDWCLMVSAQRYTSLEAASFGHGRGKHNSCHCTVVAIFGQRDPGRTINRRRLAEAKANGTLARVNQAHANARARTKAAR